MSRHSKGFKRSSIVQNTDLVIFAIGDVDHPGSIDEDSMRARQQAGTRRPVRPVTPGPIAHHGVDRASLGIDSPYRMALRVVDKHPSIRRDRDALGPG